MDREAWRAAVHGVTKSRTRLSDWTESLKSWLTTCSLPSTQTKSTLSLLLVMRCLIIFFRLPRWYSSKESICQCRRCKRHGFSPWVGKIPPEKGMATLSSILAWKVPWTVESGGLQSMGSEGGRHDWVTEHTHGWFTCYVNFCHRAKWFSCIYIFF